ncbi:MAG: cytochrome P450 [Chloroflexota bacterium]|nr:cytochrome P450 [Chloroflexota bacterium]
MDEQTYGCPEHAGQLSFEKEYHPFDPSQLEDPYSFFARARREQPVFFSEEIGAWVITRYDDIRSILLQPEIFSSKDTLRPLVEFTPEVFHVLSTGYGFTPHMISADGAEHTRLRWSIYQAFLPGRIKKMETVIYDVADKLLDDFSRDGHADLVAAFSYLFPLEVILLMYGVPRSRLADAKRWSVDMQALISTPMPPQRQIECAQHFVALQKYIAELIEVRQKAPGDDVISVMLAAQEQKHHLNLVEMVGALSGTLMAGHETTSSLISTAVYTLLSRPGSWQMLNTQPERIPDVVEEVLRFDGSGYAFYRTALQEVAVGGVKIPQGALLLLVYGSANHDETQFPNAEEFDLHRAPMQHVAFGHGIHFCIGAALARLETRIALERLSQRLPGLRLKADQTIAHVPNLMFRGVKKLEVEWN